MNLTKLDCMPLEQLERNIQKQMPQMKQGK